MFSVVLPTTDICHRASGHAGGYRFINSRTGPGLRVRGEDAWQIQLPKPDYADTDLLASDGVRPSMLLQRLSNRHPGARRSRLIADCNQVLATIRLRYDPAWPVYLDGPLLILRSSSVLILVRLTGPCADSPYVLQYCTEMQSSTMWIPSIMARMKSWLKR
jgi:hypothetical protein